MGTRTLPPKRKTARKPFWLPASSFYFLIAAIAVASFFLVIGIFSTGNQEPEIVIAGLTSSGILIVGVVVREVVLRHARERYIVERNRLDSNLRNTVAAFSEQTVPAKFTLEMNSAALDHIRKKSDAAKVFRRLPAGHKEVFELCEEYQRIVSAEIPNVHPESPRLKAMIRGNKEASKVHKWHLLMWAEIESRSFASEAREAQNAEQRGEFAQKAIRTLEFALARYPEEPELRASAELLDDVLRSIKIAGFVSDAEEFALSGDRASAIGTYKYALESIGDNSDPGPFFEIRERIERAIADLEME